MRLAAKRDNPRLDQQSAAIDALTTLVSALSDEVGRLVGERAKPESAQRQADQANEPAESEKPLATFGVGGLSPPVVSTPTQPCDMA